MAAATPAVAAVAASDVPLAAAALPSKGDALVASGEGVNNNNYSRPQGQNVG